MAERLTDVQWTAFRALAFSVRGTGFAARVVPDLMDAVVAEIDALRAELARLMPSDELRRLSEAVYRDHWPICDAYVCHCGVIDARNAFEEAAVNDLRARLAAQGEASDVPA